MGMVSEDEKGSKRREDVGTCWPLGVMLAEEPLDESEITRRARGGSLRNEVVPEDFKPKRLALGCSERPRLLPLFSQSGFCLGEFRECEGDCFGRLPPAASTLEEWRGRRVCWRANGGMAESLDTCPMSMVAAVLRRRNVKMHELTTRSTTKTNELQQKNKKTLHVLVGTAASTTQGTMCLLPSKLLPSNCFRPNSGLFILSPLHHLIFQHSAATRGPAASSLVSPFSTLSYSPELQV